MRNLHFRSMLVLGALAACGGGSSTDNATPTGTVAGEPGNPLGTVGGLILNVAGDTPLANVTVSLVSAGVPLTGKTDMNGLYSIPMVPAGAFILTTSLDGFESALLTGNLTGAQGLSIVTNPIATIGPIGLFQ